MERMTETEKEWFYVDVVTTCTERIAVEAESYNQALDIADSLIDKGVVDYREAGDQLYGSCDDSVTVVTTGYHKVPKGMRKFKGDE